MNDRPFSRPSAGTDVDYAELAKIFDKRYAPRTFIAHSNFNGSTRFINWMLTVLALLVVAAISGEIVVYGEVQVLQSTVNLMLAGHIK